MQKSNRIHKCLNFRMNPSKTGWTFLITLYECKRESQHPKKTRPVRESSQNRESLHCWLINQKDWKTKRWCKQTLVNTLLKPNKSPLPSKHCLGSKNVWFTDACICIHHKMSNMVLTESTINLHRNANAKSLTLLVARSSWKCSKMESLQRDE